MGSFKTFRAFLLCALTCAQPISEPAFAQNLDNKLEDSFPFVSTEQSLESLIFEFTQRTGLPIRVSGDLTGSVAIRNQSGTNMDFLDQLSSGTNATWWHNGVVVYLEPVSSITSASFEFAEIPIEELESELQGMGLSWDQYPVAITKNGRLVRFSGPTEYLKNVGEFIADLVKSQKAEAAPEVVSTQPKIYYGPQSMTLKEQTN